MEERLRKLQLRLNQARQENNKAAADELARDHRAGEEEDEQSQLYDIPMVFLKTADKRKSGPTAMDHLNDPDVENYLKGISKINKIVYEDYQKRKNDENAGPFKPRPEVVEGLANRLEKKKELLKKRNKRAQDYDISGKTKIDFINDKNKVFNRKLARDFNAYTEDIRLNIERGSNV